MIFTFKDIDRSKQHGDTIIEVLLAMSVIGIVLAAAFGIANRSVNIGQEAQERTEALKLAETQLETLKYYEDIPFVVSNNSLPFCFVSGIDHNTIIPPQATDNACRNISSTGSSTSGNGIYSISITPPGLVTGLAAYEITISWQQIGGSDTNTLTLYYKLGSL